MRYTLLISKVYGACMRYTLLIDRLSVDAALVTRWYIHTRYDRYEITVCLRHVRKFCHTSTMVRPWFGRGLGVVGNSQNLHQQLLRKRSHFWGTKDEPRPNHAQTTPKPRPNHDRAADILRKICVCRPHRSTSTRIRPRHAHSAVPRFFPEFHGKRISLRVFRVNMSNSNTL